MNEKSNLYEDIIDRYPGQIPGHPPMSNYDRAAQFAPFAALTGFGAVITESGRLTEDWKQPDESILERLDHLFAENLSDDPDARIEIVWFRADARKAGGSYIKTIGTVKKADSFRRQLILLDENDQEEIIPFERIISAERTDKDI